MSRTWTVTIPAWAATPMARADGEGLKRFAEPDSPAVIISKEINMARDEGLEALLTDDLAAVRGLTQKPMFGGMAWLVHGNLLCGASNKGLLVRLGKGKDAWALKIPGIAVMTMQGRKMNGWVRAAPDVYGDDALRRKLMEAALDFNRSLPKK